MPGRLGGADIPFDQASTAWQEYLIEAWALGSFMISIGLFSVLLEASASPLHRWIQDADLRRVIFAVALGGTAIALIYSPWGQRSGAHMNPAVTLSFLRLGKITSRHAAGYIAAQTLGAIFGVYLVWGACGSLFSAPPVSYDTTVPGSAGVLRAFIAEFCMSAALMLTLLASASRPRLAPYTGILAGALIAAFILLEAPISGMSINPARSLASAIPANQWASFWLYIFAPILGMQLAGVLFAVLAPFVPCAKLCHSTAQRCIHCGYTPTAPLRNHINHPGVST